MSVSANKTRGNDGTGSPERDQGSSAARADSLDKTYDRYFKVMLAETDEQKEQSYRLRYQVYCLEYAFEPVLGNPGQRETDKYDEQSLHGLLVHRSSDMVVGTARLIMPTLNNSSYPLPIHKFCAPEVLEEFSDRIPVDKAAELSRFAITRELRRSILKKAPMSSGIENILSESPQRVIPHISLGLMQAVVTMAAQSGITHIYAIMEPGLLRMLRSLGLTFETMGPLVNYHGVRQPCFCDIDAILKGAYATRREVWSVLTDDGRLWSIDSE